MPRLDLGEAKSEAQEILSDSEGIGEAKPLEFDTGRHMDVESESQPLPMKDIAKYDAVTEWRRSLAGGFRTVASD